MFSIFSQYPTFVVFLAVVLAIVITMALMPAFIRALRSYHIGQQVRADGPESHLVKQGTPTMGGLIMLIAVVVTVLLIGMPSPETFALVIATVLAGALGLADDGEKVVKERSLGLTPKAKLIGQFLIATVFCLVAVNFLGIEPTVDIPFVVDLDFGILTTQIGDFSIPWNSVLFLKLFLNPSVFVSSLPVVFWGFLMAIGIVACAFPLAIPFGLLLSLMRMSKLRVLRGIATAYVNVVRGTPLFLQIYIAFFGLPLAGIQIPTFPLGVIVLAMNSSAYLCEIFRAGIQSISKGQFEAARSLGMNGAQTMLYVIIPQTVRRVIPTMTSEFILLYKDTSMLAAVGTMEIVMNAKTIVASTGSITPYVVAACFYLIITLPLAKVVGNLESRLASNDTGKGGKKKRKSKKHAIGTGDAAGALGSGAGTAAAEARATGDAVAAKRPDAVEGTGITPEQMSSL